LSDVVERGSDLLSVSPYLLGSDEARNYLILFQNDKELRPTGGFMTAYTIASVDRGIFSPVSSSDIYTLDENYTPRIPAAPALIRYIQGPYVLDKNYRLRDINWSPDFSQSMEVFLEEAETAGLSGFDGVMAVDTELVVNILSAVGPVNVPGYGEFSTNFDERCNCPQVIYELESFSDVEGPIVWDPLDPTKIIYAPDNFDNRKEIIGPLMNAIIEKALTTPKENLPNLFNSLYKAFLEKHVLMYMHDEKVQTAISEFGIGGTLDDYTDDYVYINDANLGGRKSNLYVTQEVVHDVTQTDENTISRKVEITYKNPQPYDGWLNSVLPNWTRIYLPENAQVEDVSGFEDPGEVYEELGRKVISGGFRLRPQGVSRITITYKIPHKKGEVYNLTLQKQPGTSYPHHTINAAGDRSDVILSGDEHFSYEL
jgi:hypothetical protein